MIYKNVDIHYGNVIMGAIASQITSLTIVYSTVYLDADGKNIKAPRHWPLSGEFNAQMASNAENFSIWWRHHEWYVFTSFQLGFISVALEEMPFN